MSVEIKLEEGIGDLGPTLSTENIHPFTSDSYWEITTSRGALSLLHDFDPAPTIALETSLSK